MNHVALKTGIPSPSVHRLESYEGPNDRWDEFVALDPRGTFCHLGAWRDIMEDVLGHACHYVVAFGDDGEWLGVLPLVRVRARPIGDYLLSMPFLNYGGPLGSPEARRWLAEHARQEAERAGVGLLELRTRHALPTDLAVSARKVTVTLPLPATADELWDETFRAKLRSQIRRPQKEGMTTRFGLDQVDAFYEVFARTMRDLGTPVLPRRFFERIARSFGREAVFATVWARDQPVAAGCGFVWNGEFEMTWAASLREHSRSAPNMLLYWACMERMIENGVAMFNFGRCSPGNGTHRFKLQWGGSDEPLPWAQWSPRGVTETPSPDRPLFRAATSAWQRLPLSVANRLGPALARRLP